jgi:hypothetical protein
VGGTVGCEVSPATACVGVFRLRVGLITAVKVWATAVPIVSPPVCWGTGEGCKPVRLHAPEIKATNRKAESNVRFFIFQTTPLFRSNWSNKTPEELVIIDVNIACFVPIGMDA